MVTGKKIPELTEAFAVDIGSTSLFVVETTTGTRKIVRDELIDALAIPPDRFKGAFANEAALTTAHPMSVSGDYAVVDSGIGTDANMFIWDVNDGWVGSGGGISGLPVQSTDLIVHVTTDAEFTAAIDGYWSYQFTEGANYIIQLQTGYVCTLKIDFRNVFAPNLVIRTETTTTVNCAGFTNNEFGVKVFIHVLESNISSIYGTFVGINGDVVQPIIIKSSTIDVHHMIGNTQSWLTITGFDYPDGAFFSKWKTKKLNNEYLPILQIDCKIIFNNMIFSGEYFKITTDDRVTFYHCIGELTLSLEGPYSACVYIGESQLNIHQNYDFGTCGTEINVYSNSIVTYNSTRSNYYNVNANNIITVNNGSILNFISENWIWHPTNANSKFIDVSLGGFVNFGKGSNGSVNTSLATPNNFGNVTDGTTVNMNDYISFAFPVSKWTNGIVALMQNRVERNGIFIKDVSPVNSWSEKVITLTIIAGAVTIDLSLGKHFKITLTENITFVTILNGPLTGFADTMFIWVKQNAVSAKTVSLPSTVFRWEGTPPTVSTTLDALDLLAATYGFDNKWDATFSKARV